MADRIPYPIKGLDETWGASDQPPLTTRLEINMVPEDPTNGKTRGAQRAGLSKWAEEPVVAGEPVREIVTVKGPKDNLVFTEPDPQTTEWTKATESGLEVHMVRGDDLENTYWLEQPNRITKRNRDGEVVWTLSVPAFKHKQFCKVLEVDPFGTVYVAVSSSGDPDDGRLWAYQVPIDEEQPEKLYELALPGFVRHMVWKDGALFLAVNRDAAYQARIQKYLAADTIAPTLETEWDVPYPCNALAVRDDGGVYTASPPFAARGTNPESIDGSGQTAIDWTPYDLKDAPERIWLWCDSTDVAGVGGKNETLSEGERIETWYSKVGKRHFYAVPPGWNGATLHKSAFAGRDVLRFNGGVQTVGSSGDGLITKAYNGGSVEHSGQLAGVPAGMFSNYVDEHAAWAMFMVFRPDASGANVKQAVINNRLSSDISTFEEDYILLNTTNSTTGVPPATNPVNSGKMIAYDSTNQDFVEPGGGSAGQIITSEWNNAPSGACVVSLLFDAGMSIGLPATQGYRSTWRVNGQPIDRWGMESGESVGVNAQILLTSTSLGRHILGSNDFERFKGDVMEIIVLRYNPKGGGELAPIVGPPYPDVPYLAGGDSEIERMEGYLAWKWGIAQSLENNNGMGGQPGAGYIHPFGPGDLNAPPSPLGREVTASQASPEDVAKLNGPYAVLAKWTGGGALTWAYSDGAFGGVGSGVALSETGVYSVGPPAPNASAFKYAGIRRFIDLGASLSVAGSSYVFPNGSFVFPDRHVDIQSDPWFNLWIPVDDPNFSVEPPLTFVKATAWGLDSDMVLQKILILPGDPIPPGASIWVPSTQPEYGDEGAQWPERVYVGARLEQTRTLRIIPSVEGGSGFPTGVFFKIGETTYTSRSTPVKQGEFKSLPNGSDDEDQADIVYAVINGDPDFKPNLIGAPTQPDPLVQAIARGTDIGSGDETVTIKALYPGAQSIFLTGTNTAFAWDSSTFPQASNTNACSSWVIVDFDLESPAPPREVVTLAVAGGFVKKMEPGGTGSFPAGSGSLDQTTDPALDPNGIPFATILFGKIYFSDGKRLLRYTLRTDTLEVFKPRGSGAPPRRIVLMEEWRTRLVTVTSDDRWNYYMSKVGEPDTWDYFPPILSEDQATFGTHPNNTAGSVPDIVNGFVPISDDLALWLCDSTVHRLTGDPMAGGKIDLVHRASGGAFGRAWAIGPTGTVFYYGARGGIFALNPYGGAAVNIADGRIQKRTENIDLALYRPRMQWLYEYGGLLVSLVPYGAGGEVAKHWFWTAKTDRWSEFRFGNSGDTTIQPTALALVDGDGVNDRSDLVGCEDGYLRKFDPTAFDDDGVAIDSRVLIGPIVGAGDDLDARLSGITVVLGSRHHGAHLELYASDEWEDEGAERTRATLKAGRNPVKFDAVSGPAVWIGLRNPHAGQRWSLEAMYSTVQALSDAKERA